MNKTELLADLATKGLRVINTEVVSDPVKAAAGVVSYIAHVMEQHGDTVTGRNIGFYVFDEGEAEESAYYRDIPVEKNIARDSILTYLASLIPGSYIRTKLENIDETSRYAFASAWKDNGNGTATQVNLLLWKDGTNPIQHRELTI